MKRSITTVFISLLLLLSINAIAQTFAPLGAEWYYNQQDGIFHLYVSGDTIIDNIPCRIIVQKAITNTNLAQMGLEVNDLPTLYVYNNADTVFIYNTLFHHFTPLYVFNVVAGDTVNLPILDAPPNILPFDYTDSTYAFVIDSVRMVLYDTAHLKTVYTHPLLSANSYQEGYVNEKIGPYIMSIGQVYGGLLPACNGGCTNLEDEREQGATAIRCYSDSSQALKFTTSDCNPIASAVATVANPDKIYVYPNPTAGKLNINGNTDHIMNIAACDILGSKISITLSPSFREIMANGLAEGIYYFTIYFDNQPPVVQKILIQNN